MTSVVIADDDHLMRAGLAELLAADPTITVIGEAATGREAIEQTQRHDPDVVLMDVRMPDLDGITATSQIATSNPRSRVLVLTTFEDDDYIFGALRAGASGFLLKRTRPEDLIAAVHTVAAGESLLSPSVTRRIIEHLVQHPPARRTEPSEFGQLTPRERDVFELVARGLSNQEVARELVVEQSTIRTHVKRILMKLHLRDRIQIVIRAYETGIIQPTNNARSGNP
jgi:DNA-binding NarL/FixJ family response regulator